MCFELLDRLAGGSLEFVHIPTSRPEVTLVCGTPFIRSSRTIAPSPLAGAVREDQSAVAARERAGSECTYAALESGPRGWPER